MFTWPVPESYSKEIPRSGSPGSFWEKRESLYNCGVNIYAPENSDVLSIRKGKVIAGSRFTDHSISPILANTKFVVIKSDNVFLKYAGLKEVYVNDGDLVERGTKIGSIGSVLNGRTELTLEEEEIYSLIEQGGRNYLHLEILKPPIFEFKPYFIGYSLFEQKPYSLINPELFFRTLS